MSYYERSERRMASSITWTDDDRSARSRSHLAGVITAVILLLATAGVAFVTSIDVLPASAGDAMTSAPGTPSPVGAVAADDTTDPRDTTRSVEVDEPAAPIEASAPAEPADTGLTLIEVQDKLREHRFLIGPADGRSGQQTTAAIMAYQRVNGLAVDGVVGPATTAALLTGSAEPTLVGGADSRIEVDLDAQLLHLVEAGQRTLTLHVSSGNGKTYTNAGGTARARTPVGDFTIERRIHGLREAALGTLYDPVYFHRGFAIHGSPSVPAFPASHGCVRVTRADAAWLIQRLPDGMPVNLHGGTHVFTP
jgi:peptidoglycan hydrolase-like protein with peptidoglycan-binding domain